MLKTILDKRDYMLFLGGNTNKQVSLEQVIQKKSMDDGFDLWMIRA